MDVLNALGPEIALGVLGAALLLIEAWRGPQASGLLAALTVFGALAAGAIAAAQNIGTEQLLSGFALTDGLAVSSRILFCGVLGITAGISYGYSLRIRIKLGEILAILTFATIGLCQMAASGDILGIYLGLELASISSYLLAGMLKGSERSIEAALKYFLTGAFSSAVLLYGISLIYGVTGQTNLSSIGAVIASSDALELTGEYGGVLIAGLLLLFTGFLFKVSAVPLHMWVPDTYEGAPTPITAFLSVGPKAGAFIALLRISTVAFADIAEVWHPVISVIAVATMFVGNLSALGQTDIKRLLAYSSIAQAGYILAAFSSSSPDAVRAVWLYAAVYALMNTGAFGVVSAVEVSTGRTDIEGFSGLGRRAPWLGFLMTVFLISLIGIPPTGGMFAKLFVIGGLVDAGHIWLAIAVIINTVISVPYYYRIVRAMYLDGGEEQIQQHVQQCPEQVHSYLQTRLAVSPALAIAAGIAALGIILAGLLPEKLIDVATKATIAFR